MWSEWFYSACKLSHWATWKKPLAWQGALSQRWSGVSSDHPESPAHISGGEEGVQVQLIGPWPQDLFLFQNRPGLVFQVFRSSSSVQFSVTLKQNRPGCCPTAPLCRGGAVLFTPAFVLKGLRLLTVHRLCCVKAFTWGYYCHIDGGKMCKIRREE